MGLKKQFVSAILLGSALTAPLFAQDIATPSSSIDTLAIFSFNDFHGAFASDGITPGAARLVQMTQNEKQRYPHSIVVSGGDNFSGSYFSKITKGEPIKEMYEAMDVEMSAIGNHEFDWGLPYLVDTAALNIPHVAANITEEKRYTHPDWLSPYRIVERKLKDGSSLRIAFIGLTTTDTYVKTKPENLKGLQFTHPLVPQATFGGRDVPDQRGQRESKPSRTRQTDGHNAEQQRANAICMFRMRLERAEMAGPLP